MLHDTARCCRMGEEGAYLAGGVILMGLGCGAAVYQVGVGDFQNIDEFLVSRCSRGQ